VTEKPMLVFNLDITPRHAEKRKLWFNVHPSKRKLVAAEDTPEGELMREALADYADFLACRAAYEAH
jgi:hypothetical protein